MSVHLLHFAGNGGQPLAMNMAMANRHGLIAGATGTGKTVSVQVLAEGFAAEGVPVFVADVKGDLSGLVQPSEISEKFAQRLARVGWKDYKPRSFPVLFWDLFGKTGHPIRTTMSEVGPLLLSSLLQLNETQTGVLYAAFRIADDNGFLLLDLKDLQAMLHWMAHHTKGLSSQYGNITGSSVAAIQRRLLVLEEEGAESFFGEPALQLSDLMRTDFSGQGVISILDARKLINESPRLYATFLLWLLAELFEELPEVGDQEKPRLVFFFDEAHLLFEDAPKSLVDKIEQVVRLIRSKGVGVYFCTQNPLDIPDDVLGQLGLKIQHALRAFTPRDRKTIRAVAQNFRDNPNVEVEREITEVGLGEALVSFLNEKGAPIPVARALICPPQSTIGPATADAIKQRRDSSPIKGKYDQPLDRESAYEQLKERAEKAAKEDPEEEESKGRSSRQSVSDVLYKTIARETGKLLFSTRGRKIFRGILETLARG